MNRTEKHAAAAALAEALKSPAAVFSFDFRGLSVAEATDLRTRVREAGGSYRVVKNSTARWAFARIGMAGLDEHLSGMTGLAWSEDDPAALARVLHESAGDFEALRFKGGVVSTRPLDPEGFEALARLPGIETLQGQVVGLVAAPIRNLMNVLEGVPRNLILVLKAAQDKQAAAESGA